VNVSSDTRLSSTSSESIGYGDKNDSSKAITYDVSSDSTPDSSTWTTTLVEGNTTTVCGYVYVTGDVDENQITLASVVLDRHTITVNATDSIGQLITICAVEQLKTDDSGLEYLTAEVLEFKTTTGTYTTTNVLGLTVTVTAPILENSSAATSSTHLEPGNSESTGKMASSSNASGELSPKETLSVTNSLYNVAVVTDAESSTLSILTFRTLSQSLSLVSVSSSFTLEVVGAGSTQQIGVGTILGLFVLAVI